MTQEKVQLISAAVKNFAKAYIAFIAGGSTEQIDNFRKFINDDLSNKRINPFESLKPSGEDNLYRKVDFDAVIRSYPELKSLNSLDTPIKIISDEMERLKNNGPRKTHPSGGLFDKVDLDKNDVQLTKEGYHKFKSSFPFQNNPNSPDCIKPNDIFNIIAEAKGIDTNDKKLSQLKQLNTEAFVHSEAKKAGFGLLLDRVYSLLGQGQKEQKPEARTNSIYDSANYKQKEIILSSVYNTLLSEKDYKAFSNSLKKYGLSHQDFLDSVLTENTPAISLLNFRKEIDPVVSRRNFELNSADSIENVRSFRSALSEHVRKLEDKFRKTYDVTEITEAELLIHSKNELNFLDKNRAKIDEINNKISPVGNTPSTNLNDAGCIEKLELNANILHAFTGSRTQ